MPRVFDEREGRTSFAEGQASFAVAAIFNQCVLEFKKLGWTIEDIQAEVYDCYMEINAEPED